MKSINAKKIAAVAGAALLGVGLAFAGPVTFQNVPIISNSGQPVVQVVVGSHAQPSDGVAAANIAAAIGNLAYTSVPVTASVNQTEAAKVLHVVGSPSYTLSDQQVWLNESGAISSSTGGTYVFSALIGSVLNQGVQLGAPQYTKSLQGSGSYSFPESYQTISSPMASPYTASQYVPQPSGGVSGNTNAGGYTQNGGFTLTVGTTNYDNILQVTSSQLSALSSNYGTNGETEYLWITGFPVYDQASGVNNFQLLGAGGAYQIVFNKPIQNTTSSGATQINVPIKMLDQNFTIVNATGAGRTDGTQNQYSAGGIVYLASSVAPLQTVYVGHNVTSGPWNVQLQDLGQPNSNGISPASIAIYYNGQLTNESSVNPDTIAKFNVTGHLLYLNVNQTFAGLYSYQKWAKMELYTNVYKLQNGQKFNQTTNPGWSVNLLWTNTTGTNQAADALYSIVVYNTSATNLSPGQSISFIQNPSAYKLTFLGDTLGNGNYDSVTLGTTSQTLAYQNALSAVQGSISGAHSVSNITEPAQELVITSQIPNAFSGFGGSSTGAVTVDLTPYELVEYNGLGVSPSTLTTPQTNVILTYDNPAGVLNGNSLWVNGTKTLQVQIQGATSSTPGSTIITEPATFSNSVVSGTTLTNTITLSQALYNVTAIEILGGRALPVGANGNLNIQVQTTSVSLDQPSNTIIQAKLQSILPGEFYSLTGENYQGFNIGTINYNQQNGQPISTVSITQQSPSQTNGNKASKYFTAQFSEAAVPSNTAATDSLGVALFNATSGVGSGTLYQLNYSIDGTKNNVTYTSTQGEQIDVQAGFRTERGSKVVSITPTQDTFWLAKAYDMLQFAVAPSSTTSNTAVSKSYHTFGPYGIGQATNLPNVSIAKVNASIKVAGSTYSIVGIDNVTATPSVTSATTPVLLKNLTTTPLVRKIACLRM